jgi:hypothetical protein
VSAYVTWVLDPSRPIEKAKPVVIRRTVTDEVLAGPFPTVAKALRFIDSLADRLPLEPSR